MLEEVWQSTTLQVEIVFACIGLYYLYRWANGTYCVFSFQQLEDAVRVARQRQQVLWERTLKKKYIFPLFPFFFLFFYHLIFLPKFNFLIFFFSSLSFPPFFSPPHHWRNPSLFRKTRSTSNPFSRTFVPKSHCGTQAMWHPSWSGCGATRAAVCGPLLSFMCRSLNILSSLEVVRLFYLFLLLLFST